MTPAVQIVSSEEADTLWVVRDRIRFMGEVASTDLSELDPSERPAVLNAHSTFLNRPDMLGLTQGSFPHLLK